MRDLLLLAIHLLVTLAKLLGPGGACATASSATGSVKNQTIISMG
jgi:hypothetical protein